jgi:hypothetical protein
MYDNIKSCIMHNNCKSDLFPFQMLNDIFNYVDVVLFHWVKFVFSFTKKFHIEFTFFGVVVIVW